MLACSVFCIPKCVTNKPHSFTLSLNSLFSCHVSFWCVLLASDNSVSVLIISSINFSLSICLSYTNSSSLSPSKWSVCWLASCVYFHFSALLSGEWFNLCARQGLPNCLLAAAAWLPGWQYFQQLQLPNTGMSLFMIDN